MTDPVDPGLSIDCADVVELVTDYLEGVLDDATVAEIDAHLALCDGCSTYLAQMRETIVVTGHLPPEALTSEATADLVAAFRRSFDP
jgi:anti-sigma factor RsiW